MSIRCMELNIPAIIGIEKKYNYFSSFKEIEIDCENKFIKVYKVRNIFITQGVYKDKNNTIYTKIRL